MKGGISVRKKNVTVLLWGFGAMGSGMARMILKKKGFEIVGVCDRNPAIVGRSIYELLGEPCPAGKDVRVSPDIESLVSSGFCDICLLATDSFTHKAFPKIKWLVERRINVISTAEEMTFPQANRPELAAEIDRLAKANGVTVLGTGINPGMMMDLLVIMMTGVMTDVENIRVARVNSLSPFGETVMEEQGVGLTTEEFARKKSAGEIAGHVGFRESVGMMAAALGLDLRHFEQQMSPILTSVDRKSPFGFAAAGNVCGVDMRSEGIAGDGLKIEMSHPQQIEPQAGGVQTGDYIDIAGSPAVHLSIRPEINGGIGTIAVCVNMIPHVLNAKPGLKTMIDLPVPRAILGDVRSMIEEDSE